MRALELRDQQVRFRDDYPAAIPADGEVRVRVLRAGVCETDLQLVQGYMDFQGVLGHEFVGIAETGDYAGRRVVGEINCSCGQCEFCFSGQRNHCPHRSVLGILNHDGAFAEYVTVPEVNLHHVPDTLSTDVAVFTEPLAAALRIPQQIPLGTGRRIVVLGDGRLGNLCAQVLHARGHEVSVVGKHPEKLELLKQRGIATLFREDAAPERTADLVVDCTGSPTGLPEALPWVKPSGVIVLKTTVAADLQLSTAPIVIDEVAVIGSRCGPFDQALASLAAHEVDVESLISARFPFDDAVAALEQAARPGVLKGRVKVDRELITSETLASSVISVPPLARDSEMALDRAANEKIVRHLEGGGVSTLLYGGNAILYHTAPSEFAGLLELLTDIAGEKTLMIPSVGPGFGMMMDQAAILKDFDFPTAMILPTRDVVTSSGVASAVRRFVDRFGKPAVLYIKHDGFIEVDEVKRLMDDGLLSWIKYAIVRDDTSDDAYLRTLTDAVGTSRIVSGIGEQPAIVHLRDFGLTGFTSGCVCVAPRLSMDMLRAIKAGDLETAEQIRATFQPLEDLRNEINPVRVLHTAVAAAGIAETGPIMPLLSEIDEADVARIRDAASELLAVLKDHARHHGDRPFFHYVAFTAPHFPLHALPEDIARYRDAYIAGWDSIRRKRRAKQTKMGIADGPLSKPERDVGPPYHFPESLKILGPGEVNRPLAWNTLTKQQQKFQTTKMAIHAAMVDRMDRGIGRILAQLRAMKAIDNTLIMFLSDNGASAEIMVRADGHDPKAKPGSAATYLCLGPGWSTACNTPFRRHKTWVHEGGICTPFIVHWPKGLKAKGELRHNPGHVIDIAPTILDVIGGKPFKTWKGKPVPEAPGKSLAPAFTKDGTVDHETLWWMHEGNRAIRIGDWKLVSDNDGKTWSLFNLARDRSETTDLADSQPRKAKELRDAWTKQFAAIRDLATRDLPKKRKRKQQ
eukprot:g22015.t1